MKTIRRLLTLACALVAALAIAVPAYAANGPYTLTIESETPGHTYEAYQVFKGDVSADGTYLSNVEWGSGVDTTEGNGILADLKASSTFGATNPFASCTTAADVAAVLAGENFTLAHTDAFAEVAGANLVVDEKITLTGGASAGVDGKYAYTATGLEAGYYLVQDASGSLSGSQYAKTKFILEVVDDVTAQAKADQPTLDKTIASVNSDAVNSDYANAAIGDTVTFQLTSAVPAMVPAMEGYNKYFFVVTDELSQGFSIAQNFSVDDVRVVVGSTTLTGDDFAVSTTTDKEGATEIVITINDLVGKSGKITITYSATVNDKAVIGDAGNANTAYLKFSNDPNYTYDDVNDSNAPMGKTPDTSTHTYVGGLIIHKVDENNNALPAAQFKIESDDFNQVVLVGTEFVQDDTNGTYYKLKNGTYTTEAPGQNTSDYKSTTVKYKLETTTETTTPDTTTSVTSWVDANGNLIVAGLSAGIYTITETYAPDGYNIADPVKVTVGWAAPTATGSTTCTWTKDSKAVTLESSNNMKLIPVTIRNLRGATLPSTGGIGKTVLIGTGAVIAVVAVVGLVTKLRASRME